VDIVAVMCCCFLGGGSCVAGLYDREHSLRFATCYDGDDHECGNQWCVGLWLHVGMRAAIQ
jgi:hypothetical protein